MQELRLACTRGYIGPRAQARSQAGGMGFAGKEGIKGPVEQAGLGGNMQLSSS